MHGDKTGPEGSGPKTGRGLGYCSGSDSPGYKSTEPNQGMRRGNGMGAGRGRMDSPGRGRAGGRGRGMGRNFQDSDNSELISRINKLEKEIETLKK